MILCAKIIYSCQFSAIRFQFFFLKILKNAIKIDVFSIFFKKVAKNIGL